MKCILNFQNEPNENVNLVQVLGPSTPSNKINEGQRLLRSHTSPLDNTKYIICQEDGGTLQVVCCLETVKSMLHVARKNGDNSSYRRLNSISSAEDAVAMKMFHLRSHHV